MENLGSKCMQTKREMITLLKNLLKKYPLIDLGQENPKSASRRLSLSLIDSGSGGMALDAGCREGFQTRELLKKNYQVVSVDIVKLFPEAQIVDLNKPLPFAGNSFDVVYSSEVIEHLIDPAFTVSEFNRVLRPSGKLIVTTPNSFCAIFRMLSLLGLKPWRIQNKDHLHFFSIKDIKKLFPGAQVYGYFPFFVTFPILKCIPTISPCFIISSIKKSEKIG